MGSMHVGSYVMGERFWRDVWRDVWRVYGGDVDKGQHSPRWRGGGKEKEFVERLVDSGVVLKTGRRCVLVFGDEAGRFWAF